MLAEAPRTPCTRDTRTWAAGSCGSAAERVTARSAYSAAKAAANSLMTSLRLELRADFPDIHVSTVLTGVVATAFGANALHGGPDSRTLPSAQPVDEVARAIADLIEHPRAELYTRPELATLAAR